MKISDPDDLDGMPVERALRIVNTCIVLTLLSVVGILGFAVYWVLR